MIYNNISVQKEIVNNNRGIMEHKIGQQFILGKENLDKNQIDKYGVRWLPDMINHIGTTVTIIDMSTRPILEKSRYRIELKSGAQYWIHPMSLEPLNIYDI